MLVAREHGLVFNLDKCVVKERVITFFEMLFHAEGVHPDREKVEAIRAIQVPEDAQELHSFFGIAPYMAPFIPNLSVMSEPLRNLFKKGTDFHWSPSHSAAFEKIKQSICLQVSLTYFDPKRKQSSWCMKNSKMWLSHPEHSQTPRNDMQILNVRCFAVVVVACEKFHSFLFGRVRSQTS